MVDCREGKVEWFSGGVHFCDTLFHLRCCLDGECVSLDMLTYATSVAVGDFACEGIGLAIVDRGETLREVF